MKQVKPYRTLAGAVRALDNGGRFYNIFTAAGDEVVSKAEFRKAAGGLTTWPAAILYYEMSILALTDSERSRLAQMLAPDVAELRRKHEPAVIAPAGFDDAAAELMDQAVIIEGQPHQVDDLSRFGGVIMIPIMTGKVMSFMPIPITEQFTVYELIEPGGTGDAGVAHVAVPKTHQIFEGCVVRIGGIVKQFEKGETDETRRHYIEAVYYTRVADEA